MADEVKKTSSATWFWVFAVAGLFVCWGMYNDTSAPVKQSDDPDGIYTEKCQRYAKEKLSQPATADFDWSRETYKNSEGGVSIRQKLTAKNGFGVPGRMLVSCWFKPDGSLDIGNLEEITE